MSSVMDNTSLAAAKAEIEKCVVLCANCYRKAHAGKIALPTD